MIFKQKNDQGNAFFSHTRGNHQKGCSLFYEDSLSFFDELRLFLSQKVTQFIYKSFPAHRGTGSGSGKTPCKPGCDSLRWVLDY